MMNHGHQINTFEKLGTKYKTDKTMHHGYHFFYPRFLEPLRNETFTMLEIGLGTFEDNTGTAGCVGNSPKLWKEYFSNAKVFVMDIDYEYMDEYGTVIKGDQSNIKDIIRVANQVGPAKFIIDDGSHHAEHQLLTFNYLFQNLLEPGGVYIIEDIECSYWKPDTDIYGYRIGYLNIIDYFTKYQHELNSEFNHGKNTLEISSISYGQNCIIITKQTAEEKSFYNRQYRFGWKI
jgi:hypothetical protein